MKNKNSLLNIPIFFIFPFVSFLIAIRNLKSRTNGILFVAFCTLFGFSFAFSNDSADSYRVALVFNEFNYQSIYDIYQLYLLGGAPDLYRFLTYALVKSFTDNPKILFATFGLVFGFFWYLSLRVFKKEQANYSGFYASLLFFLFIIINPITNINGARFNTAIWVFFYGVINVVLYNKNRYLLLVLCAPLVHFSFLFGVIVILLYLMLKKITYSTTGVNKILYYSFIGSFIISWVLESNIISFDFIGGLVPSDSISNKIGTYNSSEVADIYKERASNSPFLMVSNFFQSFIKIVFFAILVYLKRKLQRYNAKNLIINKLMAFVFFYFTFSFIIATMPSGGRFLMVGYLFALVLILIILKEYENILNKRFVLLLIPAYSFTFFFNVIFLSISITSYTVWYGNLFWLLYEGWDYKFIYI